MAGRASRALAGSNVPGVGGGGRWREGIGRGRGGD